MASVELRPGDTLNIVWTSLQNTPFGMKEVESNFAFTYDELLLKLKTNGREGKSRRSRTNGARFSRIVGLSTKALEKGKWSTGATIDRDEVFAKLIGKFNELEPAEYSNITLNARSSIQDLYVNSKFLKDDQKRKLKSMVDAVTLN